MTEVTKTPASTPLKRFEVIRSSTCFSAEPAMLFKPSVSSNNPKRKSESPASNVTAGVIQLNVNMCPNVG